MTYGKPFSAETRRKISEAKKGQIPWNKGTHLSVETRRKISEAHKGANNPNYGKPFSAETRRRMSDAHKGKTAYWNKKAVICAETGTLYGSIAEAAESVGVAKSGITKVLHGIYKTSGGFHWRYAGREQ